MTRRFTREAAAAELVLARRRGLTAGRSTPVNASVSVRIGQEPYDSLASGWDGELLRAWRAAFDEGQKQRRSELTEIAQSELPSLTERTPR